MPHMQPDPQELDIARQWLATAAEDLALSRHLVGNRAFPRQASYGAQQAAEKAIKAVLCVVGVPFPKTHDLVQLAALIPTDHPIQGVLQAVDLATLTIWAVRGRYPSTGPAAMQEESHFAVDEAARIVAAVERELL